MKTLQKTLIISIIAIFFGVFAGSASATTLSQTNLSLSIGQSSVVTAYPDSNYYNYYTYSTFYVSSNSNSNVATATVNGNTVSIYAVNTGYTTIVICQNNGGGSCASIYVTVSGGYNGGYYGGGYYNGNNNGLSLSISNMVLPHGGNITLTSTNTAGIYVSNNSNPNVASTLNVGSSSGVSGCIAGAQYSTFTGQPCFNQYNNNSYYNNSYYSSTPGCIAGAQYSNITGQPCFNNYNNQYSNQYNNPVNGIGNSIEILGNTAGTDTITFCQSSPSVCSPIYVTVF